MINFREVSKNFKTDFWLPEFQALKSVNFDIRAGRLTGFLGANGAGKTTSLKIMMDFVKQTKGEVIYDPSLGKTKSERFSNIGYLPERPYFYQSLTGQEFLLYMGKLQKMKNSDIKDQILKWSKVFGVDYALDRKIKSYSKGMLQRLGMASTLIHRPTFIILDEPLSGLDPVGRKEIKDVLLSLNKEGQTVFFSTHIVSDVEEMCHDVIVLEHGVCVYSGDVNSLIETSDNSTYEIKYKRGDEIQTSIVNIKEREKTLQNLLNENASILSTGIKRQSLESIIYKIKEND